ncbi:MAG: UbiX family flavin prenyltransferase [Promethearchaeota archaeon]
MLVAISGATCIKLGIQFLKLLHEKNVPVDLIISDVARQIIEIETNESIEEIEKLATRNYQFRDLTAPPASGSSKIDNMVIIPCSMKTLSAIAHGYSDNLITRAADVMIKEKRKLIVVPRESPLSVIHLKNMLTLAKLGVIIFPPIPSCYHHPRTIEDLFNHVLGRLLDQLGIESNIKRWDEIYEKLKK